MPLQEFWYDDPELLWVYRFSYIKKIKAEEKRANLHAWLNGYYNHIAIVSALSKGVKYLKKPIETEDDKQIKNENNSKMSIAERIKANMNRAKNILEKRKK